MIVVQRSWLYISFLRWDDSRIRLQSNELLAMKLKPLSKNLCTLMSYDTLPATISRPRSNEQQAQRRRLFSTRGSGNLITGRGGPGLSSLGLMRGCLVRLIGM